MPLMCRLCAHFSILVLLPIILLASQTHADETIRITQGGFVPATLEIPQGTLVWFVNEDSAQHWPASDVHPTHTGYPGTDIRNCGQGTAQGFDTCRELAPGSQSGFRFDIAGRWHYHDHVNPAMLGTIIVQADSTYAGTSEQMPFATEKSGTKLSLAKKIMAFARRVWFDSFPEAGAKQLSKLNMLDITESDADIEYWMRIFGYETLLDKLVHDSNDPALHVKQESRTGACHTEGHYIGRVANKLFGLSTVNERLLDPRCQFGFYHGVIEASFGSLRDEDTIQDAVQACLDTDDTMRSMFCAHAIGHGLVIHNNYDLPTALKRCSMFDPYDAQRKICYQGAFMENVFVTLGFGLTDHKTEWIDLKRPDFPCTSTALPDQSGVLDMCYFTQPIVWRQLTEGFDAAFLIQGCDRVPHESREMCFQGLGFSLALEALFTSDDDLVTHCSKAPGTADRTNCLVGALFTRTMIWGDREHSQGFKNSVLCRGLGFTDANECDAFEREKLTWMLDS